MANKLRKRVVTKHSFNPKWEGFIEGYVVNFLKKNFWRVSEYMEYQDCLQEAHCVFLRLKRKYGNMDSPRHFMALYKVSWINEFNDLSTSANKYKTRYCLLEENEEEIDQVEQDNDGRLSIMMEQAPSDVKIVLQLMLTAPVEVLDMFASMWKSKGNGKEFGNKHLCEILGLPQKTDIVGKINSYFSE
jgi:hypothetical protein